MPRQVLPRRLETLRRQWPLLLWAPTSVVHEDGTAATYQLFLGVRPALAAAVSEDLDPAAVIGEVPAPEGRAVVYDALADPDLCLEIGALCQPRRDLRRPRPLGGDYSNSSVVFDDEWILKVFRRIEDGPNPDVEVTEALGRVGCEDVVPPVSVWRRGQADLAALRRFHPRAVGGLTLADASLQELLRRRVQPRETSTDFGPEAATLGRAVARVHVALAAAFGSEIADAGELSEQLLADLHRSAPAAIDLSTIEAAYRKLASARDLGRAIRIHGDLHLGQVLRNRRGWLLIDFEGEPARPLEDRRRPSSPIRDVAGMVRSFHYAAEMALGALTGGSDDAVDPELPVLAAAWEERATDAFLTGYASIEDVHPLLPGDRRSRDALLTVYELDKAVYEAAYELAHRPQLAHIPFRAVGRLLESERPPRW